MKPFICAYLAMLWPWAACASVLRASRVEALQGGGHAPKESQALLSSQSQVIAQESWAIDRQLELAATVAPSDTTRQFLQSLRLCADCRHFERFGEPHDGGYVMCADGLESGLVAAYSYGINGYDGWGMQVAKNYQIPLFEFDCNDHRKPTPCRNCNVHFSPTCLKGPQEPKAANYATFDEMMAKNGHLPGNDTSILLKVDIEAAEWGVFPEESTSTLQKFRQIVIEYHWLRMEKEHGRYLRTTQHFLDAGFVPVHLHGNNNGGMAKFGQYSVPDVLEVTYVRRPAGQSKCPSIQPRHLPQDARNALWTSELPSAKLPSI